MNGAAQPTVNSELETLNCIHRAHYFCTGAQCSLRLTARLAGRSEAHSTKTTPFFIFSTANHILPILPTEKTEPFMNHLRLSAECCLLSTFTS